MTFRMERLFWFAAVCALSSTLLYSRIRLSLTETVSYWKTPQAGALQQTDDAAVPATAKAKTPRKTYYYNETWSREDDENTFQGVSARVFPKFEYGVPCEQFQGSLYFKAKPKKKGLFFTKTIKTGSTSGVSIHLRIARNEARRRQQREQRALSTGASSPFAYEYCDGDWRHEKAHKLFRGRSPSKSFLWSIVREPQSRIISHYFFRWISRDHRLPLDREFPKYLQNFNVPDRVFDHYMKWLPAREAYQAGITNPVEHANQLLQDYDFIAITERVDESAVALAMILNIPLSDVLFLSSKVGGGFDYGTTTGCTYIIPSFVSPGMNDVLRSPEFQAKVRWDHVVYQAVNRSLDLTIDHLGRATFEKHLATYRHAQQVVQEKCNLPGTFPCSNDGTATPSLENGCEWLDAGCNFDCLDEVATELDLWHPI
eukprot:scaffold4420_cov187-Amphora_coffeaeformis.AAC.1